MRKLLLLLVFLPFAAFPQGLLRSSIVNPEDTVYHLEVWHLNWDSGLYLMSVHPFRISTTTYFLPGDYVLGYYVGDTLLHAENMHVPHTTMVLEKRIMSSRVSLYGTAFVRPKKKNSFEKYIDW